MNTRSAEAIWATALGELQLQVTRANYDTWLKQTRGIALQDGTFTIGAPSPFATEWLQKRLAPLIRKTVSNVLGRDTDVLFLVLEATLASSEAPWLPLSSPEPEPPPSASMSRPVYEDPVGIPLRPKYTFSTFVIGSSNRFAHAAALGVAESPGHSYNPLFIYGGVGLGKSHLLHAIGHHCRADHLRVLYVTSEHFTNEFIQALRERRTEEFRSKYRGADVLLIDDIHFIADKEQTQESFFHTFNDLHNANRQIVISSDRPPRSMPLLEDRLRSRFEWGLIADIQPPDLETRLAILRDKTEDREISVPSEILDLIAHKFQNNVRELEGALNRVLAYSQMLDSQLTLDIATSALSQLLQNQRTPSLLPSHIITVVADFFTLTKEELLGPRRTKELVFARHVTMFLLREQAKLSLTEIGLELGGRDHTTVLHGYHRILKTSEEDTSVRRKIMEITNILHTG